jgi:hypothetical protein
LNGGLSIIPINNKKRPASWLLPQKTNETGEPLYWKELANGAWVETIEDTGKPKGTWEPYQIDPPTEGEVKRWLDGTNINALAVVCGKVSGSVEIIDFDNRSGETWYQEWLALVGDVVDRYGLAVQETGGNGFQVGYRCSKIEGNQKLAWTHAPEEAGGKKAMIETRGEGGYALLPPSLHPSGKNYRLIHGKFSQLPVIDPLIRDYLIDCARRLNEVSDPEPKTHSGTNTYSDNEGCSDVADAYNQAHSIEEVLSRYGYTHCTGNRWSRPGKPDSCGVHVHQDGRAYAHSSNDRMAGDRCGVGGNRPFSAFDLFAYYEHSEDYSAATRAAAVALGMEYKGNSLHSLIYVQGYDNAKIVRDSMFQHGWVARGFKTADNIKLTDISEYENIIVWAYSDPTAKSIAKLIPGAYPIVVPNGLDAKAMERDGILYAYLEAIRADAGKSKAQPTATSRSDEQISEPIASIDEVMQVDAVKSVPDWLKQLSCFWMYEAQETRTEKNGLLNELWENAKSLSADEMRLLNYLEAELGAPITQATNQPIE